MLASASLIRHRRGARGGPDAPRGTRERGRDARGDGTRDEVDQIRSFARENSSEAPRSVRRRGANEGASIGPSRESEHVVLVWMTDRPRVEDINEDFP